MNDITIKQLQKGDEFPWKLLLLADPSKDAINEYLPKSEMHLAYKNNELVGEYVITEIASKVYELKNVAVNKKFQGQGIGKQLVLDAIAKVKEKGATRIEVGTGNSSLSQLALYQKCGFRITGIEKDFFTKNYQEKIIENGIPCIDMVRLAIVF